MGLEGGWIRRTYKTASWKGTLMVINTVGHLAEAACITPITASYAWVEVRLQNHAAKEITDKDFELAKKIEEVVLWQPGKEGGALEGTPTDQRFAYIDYKKVKAGRGIAHSERSPLSARRGTRVYSVFKAGSRFRRRMRKPTRRRRKHGRTSTRLADAHS